MAAERLYFPIYLKPYTGNYPAFYNTRTIPACDVLEKGYDTICRELQLFMQSHDVTKKEQKFRHYQKGWDTIMLLNYMLVNRNNLNTFPQTHKILAEIPGITLAYFSLLAPNTEIPEHNGDTNATYRIHLGMDVPSGECGITVNGETRNWENGKTLAFCDAHRHSAHNFTDKQRIVLIVDVLKEDYLADGYMICSKTLASLGISRLAGPFFFLRYFPKFMMQTLQLLFTGLFSIILFFNRILYFRNFRHAIQPTLVRHS